MNKPKNEMIRDEVKRLKTMSENDSKCHRKLSMKMTAYLVTLQRFVRKIKKAMSEMKMSELVKMTMK